MLLSKASGVEAASISAPPAFVEFNVAKLDFPYRRISPRSGLAYSLKQLHNEVVRSF